MNDDRRACSGVIIAVANKRGAEVGLRCCRERLEHPGHMALSLLNKGLHTASEVNAKNKIKLREIVILVWCWHLSVSVLYEIDMVAGCSCESTLRLDLLVYNIVISCPHLSGRALKGHPPLTSTKPRA